MASGPDQDAAGDGGSPRRASVRDLPPSIFAVVMATGIVAEAADAAGARSLARGLLAAAGAAFAVLLTLLLARCLRFPAAVLRDARSHAAAPGFLTLAAATGVLGTGCVRLADAPAAGLALWAATALLWVGLTYALLPALIAAGKPADGRGIDGTWLLVVVATEAVAALGGALLPHLPAAAAGPAGFAALCFWLAGVAQYLWLAPLVLHRLVFVPLDPADLSPRTGSGAGPYRSRPWPGPPWLPRPPGCRSPACSRSSKG
jgi:tellurite resistance protein TehA-like permease